MTTRTVDELIACTREMDAALPQLLSFDPLAVGVKEHLRDLVTTLERLSDENARLRERLSELAAGAVDPSDRRIALRALDGEDTK